ncbi:right-handed parallel beta-helix repeat-containing protein [Hwangdonia lutea]|uniref:Right-handed parallel beta-helix repeat-containing protein n=1 Tax=Hwangdonia lutea TaxID=3075823 RepID=A0AA97HRV2_9FLAO|nr:right-handed parallel beta-helix repeat-containing protein [Hwangdonia sp. SCSIO 19198]WOD43878.1 right-handed parallel beta-helix repeat-containing protein [Hwangdonia sp. SCSIO 19198]
MIKDTNGFGKNNIKSWIFCICLLLGFVSAGAKTTNRLKLSSTLNFNKTIIKAEKFGVIPNTLKDMAPKLNNLINEASKYTNVTIEFQKGRYDIWPEHSPKRDYFISNTSSEIECPSKTKTIALLLEEFNDITIEGNGALFVLHGKTTNFAFVNCNGVKMQNISFDYKRPTMSELKLEKISNHSITASVNPSSTFDISNGQIDFYGKNWHLNKHHTIAIDPKLSTAYYSDFSPLLNSQAKRIAPFKVVFKGDFTESNYKKGQVLTVRDPIRDQVGGFIGYSKNIELKNVNMHYMHGMGIVSQFSENITYDGVKVKPRKETGRKIAAFADSFHFSGCKGQITIKNCTTSGAHDDAVNIHGTHLKVIEKIANNKINLKFMHHQTYGFDAFFKGDTLNFVKPKSLQNYGVGIVKKVSKISDRELQITLDNNLPVGFKIGDVVENITWTPSVLIKNNYFSGTNTRGVLLTTRRKSIIENNVFYRTGMHAILIANDASSWYESGAVRDVTIKGNQFIECGYNLSPNSYVINIWPENHKEIPNYFVHENIVVENNLFKIFDTPILRAKSAKGLIFKNNKIVSSNILRHLKGNKPSFYFQQCKDVFVELNKTNHGVFDFIEIKNMTNNNITVKNKK